MQLVLEGCGETYCPWDTFKEIALGAVNFDCIQEPLRDSSEAMYADATDTSTGGDDDDDALDTWMIIAFTAGACTVIFALLQVAVFQYQKNKATESSDIKEPLVYQ